MRILERMRLNAAVLALLLPATLVAQPSRSVCRNLRKLRLPATAIALPTSGVTIQHASLRRRGPHQAPEFCKVIGSIHSVDPQARDIHFELNLPTAWNRKAVHFGGAAFDGYLRESDGLGAPVVSAATDPTPLSRGYATFGSDSGHSKSYFPLPDVLNLLNARFALNDEMRRNYAHDALKKTHDTAVAILRTYYGSAPSRMFFLGGSTGGREAYFVTQLWPADYDGVLGAYAGWD